MGHDDIPIMCSNIDNILDSIACIIERTCMISYIEQKILTLASYKFCISTLIPKLKMIICAICDCQPDEAICDPCKVFCGVACAQNMDA